MVVDLIQRPVAVIVCNGIAALTAKAATTTVPIVFATGGDPVALGLVASLNRPGGNVTGASFFTGVLGEKRLELLRQLVPKATTIAVLVHPNTTQTEAERRDLQATPQAVGQQLIIFDVGTDGDIEAAFATIAQRAAGALLIGTGTFMFSQRERLVALAARHGLPAIYSDREFALAGGLMSYAARPVGGLSSSSAPTPGVSSRAKSRPTCRSCSRPSSSWSSTSRPPRRSASTVPPTLLARADEVIE